MKFDFAASEPHYAEHLLPIWRALDPGERGDWFVGRRAMGWLAAQGVDCTGTMSDIRWGDRPIVTAAWQDYDRSWRWGRGVALLEHGAGQDYGDGHPSNPGGREREHVGLFLCTNQSVADRNLEAYPDAMVRTVGCPKLDTWHLGDAWAGRLAERVIDYTVRGGRPTVAVSFHWENGQCPESRSAFAHYQMAFSRFGEQLSDLAERYALLGHGHPRIWGRLEGFWKRQGIEATPWFEEVLRRADLFVCDNSSTLFEFASTGRPVVVLNAPWYRRDVDHGLRFWQAIPGLQCDEPGDLPAVIERALADPPEAQESRLRGVGAAYAACDGQAALRAAEALRSWRATDGTPDARPPRQPGDHAR